MKKEKKVSSYQRKTKSGKITTVRAHTAKYDAADKKAASAKGAGSEFERRKAKSEVPSHGISAEDFKEWYHWDQEGDFDNEAANRVEEKLIAYMGKRKYNKYFDEMSDNYRAKGHVGHFRKLGETLGTEKQSVGSLKKKLEVSTKSDTTTAQERTKQHLDALKKIEDSRAAKEAEEARKVREAYDSSRGIGHEKEHKDFIKKLQSVPGHAVAREVYEAGYNYKSSGATLGLNAKSWEIWEKNGNKLKIVTRLGGDSIKHYIYSI